MNDQPCIFLLDWWIGLLLPLVAAWSVSGKNHFLRILRTDPIPI